MSSKEIILMTVAAVVLFSTCLLIIYGDNGLIDLMRVKEEKSRLVEKNKVIRQENVSLYREIDRMNHDPDYIEEVARKELGVIGPGEVIIRIKEESEKTGKKKDEEQYNRLEKKKDSHDKRK